MMKLMNVLVLALVAGGVFAALPNQAIDLDSEIEFKIEIINVAGKCTKDGIVSKYRWEGDPACN